MTARLTVETVARLRQLVASMERELGLDEFSQQQLDVLYVVRLLCACNPGSVAETAAIRSHPMVRTMSQPTFNRAVRVLLDREYLAIAPNAKAKRYVIGPKCLD